MDSSSLQSDPVGASRRSLAGTIWQMTLLVLVVLPVVISSIFQTSIQSSSGRAGLLMPALILADDAHRQLIWLGFIGINCSVLIALFFGLWLGFLSLSLHTKIGRLTSWLALLPGRGPVWVLPLFFAIWIDELKAIGLGSDLPLMVWVLWAGWWGATRVALSIKTEAALVSQAEWESSRILGASIRQGFRTVIKPRIQNSVCKELKIVGAACLFDPTPVLFFGVSRWPLAELVHSLQRSDGMGVAVATTWALWMIVVLAVSNGLIQLATGARNKNAVFQTAVSSGTFRAMTFSVPFGAMIVGAIWPLIFMIGVARWTISQELGQSQNFLNELGLIVSDTLTQWAWMDGLVIGLCLSIVTRMLIGRVNGLDGLAESGRRFTAGFPLGFMVTGFTVSAMACQSKTTGWQDLIFFHPSMAILAWGLILITFCMAGISNKCATSDSEAEKKDRIAAQEAAIGFGATARTSHRMSRKPGSASDDWIWMIDFFSQWWWVWSAPAWGMSGLILATPAPMWGAFLSRFGGLNQDSRLWGWLLTMVPVLVAGVLKSLISRKTIKNRKVEPISRESVR